MWGRTLLFAVIVAGCSFDPGVPSLPEEPGAAEPDSAPDTPAADAASPDATPDCVDNDGDGAWVSLTGMYCGPILDCDDSDPRVHPTQDNYFATERSIGGYDFDCDGVETRINTKQGAQCHTDFFDCKGTGWMAQVPECGATGYYHECSAGFFSCNESQGGSTLQLCR